jgi:hypothetical protein
MARVDAIISDDLEREFRIQVTRRFGCRKGDLSKALEEAMQIWIKSDIIENIKKKVMNDVLSSEFRNLIDTMKSQGKGSVYALSELLHKPNITSVEMQQINKAIRELSG